MGRKLPLPNKNAELLAANKAAARLILISMAASLNLSGAEQVSRIEIVKKEMLL